MGWPYWQVGGWCTFVEHFNHSRFIRTFRGHVGPVYRATWGPDSRMFITASEDSTIKLWKTKVPVVGKELIDVIG